MLAGKQAFDLGEHGRRPELVRGAQRAPPCKQVTQPSLTLLPDDGIVVVGEVGPERYAVMEAMRVPIALRERLGQDATLGLIELLDAEKGKWSDEVLSVAADRFERRLAEQISGLRIELHDGLAAVRQELATVRFDLLKWSFLFWVGQVAAMAGLLAYMLRASGR